jgi:hypothetical protein
MAGHCVVHRGRNNVPSRAKEVVGSVLSKQLHQPCMPSNLWYCIVLYCMVLYCMVWTNAPPSKKPHLETIYRKEDSCLGWSLEEWRDRARRTIIPRRQRQARSKRTKDRARQAVTDQQGHYVGRRGSESRLPLEWTFFFWPEEDRFYSAVVRVTT